MTSLIRGQGHVSLRARAKLLHLCHGCYNSVKTLQVNFCEAVQSPCSSVMLNTRNKLCSEYSRLVSGCNNLTCRFVYRDMTKILYPWQQRMILYLWQRPLTLIRCVCAGVQHESKDVYCRLTGWAERCSFTVTRTFSTARVNLTLNLLSPCYYDNSNGPFGKK